MNVRRISAAGVAVLAAGGMTGATLGTGENLSWVPATVTAHEEDGHAVLTVERDACQSGRFRMSWWTPYDPERDTAGSADHPEESGMHDFPKCTEGSTDKATVTVPIYDDDEDEGTEHFSVGLEAGRGTYTNDTTPLPTGGVREAQVVILDDDGEVTVSTEDVTVKEADGVVAIPVTVENVGEPTSVGIRTFDGTAKAGDDYEPREDGVDVGADGKGIAEIRLAVDDEPEADESFEVSFAWGEALARAVVTITDPERPTETTPTTTTTTETTPPPVPPAQPQPQPEHPAPRQTQRSATLPPAKCVSRRRFTITLGKYRSASVRLDGARVKTVRRNGRLVAQVDLRGRPKGEFSVTITGRAAKGGAKRSETRRYRTCTPRKRTTTR